MAPLTGIKVIEMGVMIAVPGAAGSLAGLGASVIKVEDTRRGDELRNYGSSRGGMSTWFANVNAGKRSLSVDLTCESGASILWQLLADADVFIQGFRAGVVGRLGFDHKSVRERFPRLVYCSSTGFGETGPYADLPAYDPVIQALSGWAGFQTVGGNPSLHKAMVSDKTAAMYNTQAILAALVQRGRTGQGCYIEASMLESNIMFNWPDVMMQCSLEEEDGYHVPNIFANYRLYECNDGFVTIAVGNDKQWQAFCEALDASSLLEDQRLSSARDRAVNMAHFFDTQARVVASLKVTDVVTRLRSADVPVAPVHRPEEVRNDPQVHARNFIEEKRHPRLGRFVGAKPPVSMFHESIELSPAPMLGEQSREILLEQGFDGDTIDSLIEQGVINCFDE